MSDERLLSTFLGLVRTDSPSRSEGDVAARVASMLAGLGCEVGFDASSTVTGSDTGNLVATLPGTVPGRTVTLSAHLDTVEPGRGIDPVVDAGRVRAAGETVLGADDKSGIAAIVEALTRAVEDGRPRPTVKVVLTVCEERGLVGAKALDPAIDLGDLCLVLDAEGGVGGIVTAAPTHYTFVARFRGTASHAGVRPEAGRSAIVMASRAIAAMTLGRLDARTTANVGTIEGGTATNVVAAQAVVTGECRSIEAVRVEEVRRAMDLALRDAAAAGGGGVDVEWTKEYEGFSLEDGHPLLSLVEAACADAGVVPRRFETGGGSDANIFAARGVPALVLSTGMTDVHGTEESLSVADLLALARLLEAVLVRALD